MLPALITARALDRALALDPADVGALPDTEVRAALNALGFHTPAPDNHGPARLFVALANVRHTRINDGKWTEALPKGCTVFTELDNDGRIRNLPPRCAERAETVRVYARDTARGQGTRDLGTLTLRILWDAPAASEYPRPALSDAADLAAVRPDLAGTGWHHTAGATILGPGCDCNTPAGHRDALQALARTLTA